MKKYIYVLISIVLSFSITSCSAKKENPNSNIELLSNFLNELNSNSDESILKSMEESYITIDNIYFKCFPQEFTYYNNTNDYTYLGIYTSIVPLNEKEITITKNSFSLIDINSTKYRPIDITDELDKILDSYSVRKNEILTEDISFDKSMNNLNNLIIFKIPREVNKFLVEFTCGNEVIYKPIKADIASVVIEDQEEEIQKEITRDTTSNSTEPSESVIIPTNIGEAYEILKSTFPNFDFNFDREEIENGEEYFIFRKISQGNDGHNPTTGWYYVSKQSGQVFEFDLINLVLIPIN